MSKAEQNSHEDDSRFQAPERVLMTFTCIDDNPEKSYRLIIFHKEKVPSMKEITDIIDDPQAPKTFDHCTELCFECPELVHGSLQQVNEKVKYEILVGSLLSYIKSSYKRSEPVDERIKDAYRQCLRVLHHCEPLETQYPIY